MVKLSELTTTELIIALQGFSISSARLPGRQGCSRRLEVVDTVGEGFEIVAGAGVGCEGVAVGAGVLVGTTVANETAAAVGTTVAFGCTGVGVGAAGVGIGVGISVGTT